MSKSASAEARTHLVWSNVYRAWWAPAQFGYVTDYTRAGVFSHADAIAIATAALPGLTIPPDMLPEIPVSLADVEAMLASLTYPQPLTGKANE